MKTLLQTLTVALTFWVNLPALAQLRVNEICTRNQELLDQFDESPDWIEVVNVSNQAVELVEYFISDDFDQPLKWSFPDDTLYPGEHAIYFGLSVETSEQHMNFSFSGDGDQLFFSHSVNGLISATSIPFLKVDDSYGWSELYDDFKFFEETTPAQENNTQAFEGYATDPFFPQDDLIFLDSVLVQIWPSAFGAELRYTLDSGDPGPDSELYSQPFYIDEDATVRVIEYLPGHIPSNVISRTYLKQPDTDLPIVSLLVDPEKFFDPINGLYMEGPNAEVEWPHYGANFWKEDHVLGNIEIYNNGLVLNQSVEVKIHGGKSSRNMAQRPLRITADPSSGNHFFDAEIFHEQSGLNHFKDFILRNSGSDFLKTNFRDGFWHSLIHKNELNIDALAFQPARVYINGEYWGLMNMRERVSEFYLASHHHVDPENIIIVEKESQPFIGDTTLFVNFRDFVLNNDLANQQSYLQVQDQLDIDSYIDYFAFEIFAGNPDWPANNIKFWRSTDSSKWRYLLFDLDTTAELYDFTSVDQDMFYWIYDEKADAVNSRIFMKIMENDSFRHRFLNRLADMMNTVFRKDLLNTHLDSIVELVAPEIPSHFERWGGNLTEFTDHTTNKFPYFLNNRSSKVRDQVVSHFEEAIDVSRIEFEVYPPGSGSIDLNSLKDLESFKGSYFSGIQIALKAKAEEGYAFSSWSYNGQENTSFSQSELTLDPSSSGKLIAYFNEAGSSPMTILKNPVLDGVVRLELKLPGVAAGELSLVDLEGSILVKKILALTKGTNYAELNVPLGASSGVFLLEFISDDLSLSEKVFIQAVQ